MSATQAQATLDDVAQLADKLVEVKLLPVSPVYHRLVTVF
jgi:hypothetical protein